MGKKIDLTGQRFGRWGVTGLARVAEVTGVRYWAVRCDCGHQAEINSHQLLRGSSRSCGCLRRELTAKRVAREGTAFRCLLSSYKKQAIKRGLDFDLSSDEFQALTQKPCHYCGALPSNCSQAPMRKDGTRDVYTYNGVDRLDNTEGYTPKNSVACCALHNDMKGTLTVEQFLQGCQSALNGPNLNFVASKSTEES